jgi:16S rRNA (cytosine967-C5)-methyltransferase
MSSIDTKYPDAIILDKNYKILNNKLYKEGFFEIQDANSQQVSVWVDPKPGMKVVDACAGAGGKTLHLVSLMNNKGEVYCIDKYPNKLEILRKRTHKNGVTIVKTILEEDHSFFDKNKHQMDCVLIDVPCSSLGVLKRKPELKWKINKKTSEGLESIQKNLLQKNSSLVKNGGVLIYATCTLFKNENEDQIDSFLTTEKGKRFNLIKQETFYSHKTGYDGFFIAKLVANNVNN